MDLHSIFGNFDITDFLLRTTINIVSITILARWLYYPKYKNKEFLFTFGIFNSVIFLLCLLLSSANIEMGFAFGLFAVFSILRYRTVTIPVREMGYFFMSVSAGIINALFVYESLPILLIFINILLLAMVFILDGKTILEHENFKYITYDNLNMIHESKREELLHDLYEKLGTRFHRIEVNKIDFFKETARMKAFYYSSKVESSSNEVYDNE